MGLKVAGCLVDGQFLSEYLCYGIPVGTPGYRKYQLSLKVQEVARDVEQIVRVLEGGKVKGKDHCKIKYKIGCTKPHIHFTSNSPNSKNYLSVWLAPLKCP